MTTQRKSAPGFSLVELIVVMAIIGLISAVAIPGLAKMGLFSKDEARNTARELLTLMKAAQVYATTYRVDTAVAYTVSTVTDSVTSAKVQTIDGMAMVRRLTSDEFNALEAARASQCASATCDPIKKGSETGSDYPFVPLTNEEGKFQSFKKGASALVTAPTAGETGPQFQAIRIYLPAAIDSPDGFAITPRLNTTQTTAEIYANEYESNTASTLYPDPNKTRLADYQNARFPAHVFKPNGTMEGSLGRMLVYVTASPDSMPQERYINDNHTTTVEPYVIELYPTMGRLKITYGKKFGETS